MPTNRHMIQWPGTKEHLNISLENKDQLLAAEHIYRCLICINRDPKNIKTYHTLLARTPADILKELGDSYDTSQR